MRLKRHLPVSYQSQVGTVILAEGHMCPVVVTVHIAPLLQAVQDTTPHCLVR